mmetsp:Transcript_21395/g.49810  ORF Transcript_21395/g.49810 Transcript_21395/m.49810 type:complete len:228 (-) Transcript_21395:448-1131(-)
MVADAAVPVEVKHVEPVLHGPVGLAILVAEQETDEVLVAHLPRHRRSELRGDLTEDALYRAPGECVTVVLEQVVLVQEEVMVRVQLPERAVNYVEVLVAEVVADHLDVVVIRQLLPSLYHGGLVAAQAVQVDATHILAVVHEEDPADHRVRVAILKLLRLTEKVQARVRQEDGCEEDAEVLPLDPVVVLLLHDKEEAQHQVIRLDLALGPADNHLLGDGHRAWVQQS